MSDVPPHVEQKWKAAERKAQLPGATLSKLQRDIEDAVRCHADWLLSENSVKQLAEADSCKE